MPLGQWVGFLALIISLIILWQIREILLLIFAAIVFAAALNRVVCWFQRRGIQRGIATALTISGLLLILAGFGAIIIPAFIDQFQQLIALFPQVLNQIQLGLDWLQEVLPGQLLDIRNLGGLIPRVQSFLTGLFGNLLAFFTNVVAIALAVVFVLVLMIMLLGNPRPYRRGLVLLFPSFYRRRVEEILDKCEAVLVGWITGTLINMTVVAVASYIGLLILNVPLPLVNALLAGLLEFIPNLGPTLSAIPPIAVALLDSPGKAFVVLILYFLIQQLESYVLTPFVMRQQVSLLPAMTLTSIVIFGAFFGFLGVFLAVPLVITLRVWLQEVLIKDVLNRWDSPPQGDRQEERAAKVKSEV